MAVPNKEIKIINHTPRMHQNTVQGCALISCVESSKAYSHEIWGTLFLLVHCSYVFAFFYLRHHLFKISRPPSITKNFPRTPLFAVAKISGPPFSHLSPPPPPVNNERSLKRKKKLRLRCVKFDNVHITSCIAQTKLTSFGRRTCGGY